MDSPWIRGLVAYSCNRAFLLGHSLQPCGLRDRTCNMFLGNRTFFLLCLLMDAVLRTPNAFSGGRSLPSTWSLSLFVKFFTIPHARSILRPFFLPTFRIFRISAFSSYLRKSKSDPDSDSDSASGSDSDNDGSRSTSTVMGAAWRVGVSSEISRG
jgi:hypothetical protein